MEKSPDLLAAEFLVVGFMKCWDIKTYGGEVYRRFGVNLDSLSFMPNRSESLNAHCWAGAAPIRGYVQQNRPKLAEFLDKAEPAKKLKAAEQILKLKWNGKRWAGSLSNHERHEVNKDRKKAAATTKSYRLSRAAFTRKGN